MTGLRFALFFADGRAFLVAVPILMACIGALAGTSIKRKKWIACWRLGVVLTSVAIGLSAVALPIWFLGIWAAATTAWLIAPRLKHLDRRTYILLAVIPLGAGLAAWLMEFSYRSLPTFETPPSRRVCVIGDSLSAGMGSGELTWPKRLGETPGIEVFDRSAAGATTSSALLQARTLPPGESVVLLEIGGNDLLGGTRVEQYESDLRALLTEVQGSARHLIMFELPLPPLAGGYGRVQRRLAQEFDVLLLPKWVLSGVIGRSDTTLDGLHLSTEGHREVASIVLNVLGMQPHPTPPKK